MVLLELEKWICTGPLPELGLIFLKVIRGLIPCSESRWWPSVPLEIRSIFSCVVRYRHGNALDWVHWAGENGHRGWMRHVILPRAQGRTMWLCSQLWLWTSNFLPLQFGFFIRWVKNRDAGLLLKMLWDSPKEELGDETSTISSNSLAKSCPWCFPLPWVWPLRWRTDRKVRQPDSRQPASLVRGHSAQGTVCWPGLGFFAAMGTCSPQVHGLAQTETDLRA